MFFLYATFLVAALWLATKIICRSRPKNNIPPIVPWALPLFGHLLYLGSFPVKTLLKWKKNYGPIYTVKFGSFRTVILNEAKIAKKALMQTTLNDRPPLVLIRKGTLGKGMIFANYNNAEQRQLLLKGLKRFSDGGSRIITEISEDMSILLDKMSGYKDTPFTISGNFSNIILNSMWPTIISQKLDEGELQKLAGLITRLSQFPGVAASIGMFVPWLCNLLPGLTGVNRFACSYKLFVEFIEEKIVKRKTIRVKNEPKNVVDLYLDCVDNTTDPMSTFYGPKNFLPYTLVDVMAGSQLAAVGIDWAILLLAKYSGIQMRLQEEMKTVIPPSKLVCREDRANMPYTEAIISEVFRFTALIPTGIMYYASEDTEVSEYLIPKGTMLLHNTWGMMHDPEVWEKPEEFMPERFLDAKGKYIRTGDNLIFNPGKRSCLGEFLARDQMFILITRVFQRFNIRFASSKTPSLASKYGFVLHCEPFDVILEERDE